MVDAFAPRALQRLADEMEDDGVHLDVDGDVRLRLLDELDHARRPPIHETRRPMYGSLVIPADRSLLIGGDLVELRDIGGFDLARARSFADGRSTFLVHRTSASPGAGDGGESGALAGGPALAYFRHSMQYEADLVEIQHATEAFVVQRSMLGQPRLFLPDGVVDWDGRSWTKRPNAAALLPVVAKVAPTASWEVLRGLLELCVHWLSPGHVGATMLLTLGGDASGLDPDDSDHAGFDHAASSPSPGLSVRARHHFAAVFASLMQTDLATVVDREGTIRHFGVGLNVTARAELLVADPRGMRHRSARRFTFDHPDTVAFVVSEDGPVTVFSDGAAVAVCDRSKLAGASTGLDAAASGWTTQRCVGCDKVLVVVDARHGVGHPTCPVCGTVDGLGGRRVAKVHKEWPPTVRVDPVAITPDVAAVVEVA